MISVDTATLRAVGDPSLTQVSGVKKALEVGRKLEVTVRQNPQSGKPEILLLGNNVPATLPDNVKPGDNLTLQVVQNTDAIVLKIISAQEPLDAAPESRSLESLLKSLLPKKSIDDLKLAALPLNQEIGDQIINPELLNKLIAGKDGEVAKMLKDLLNVLQSLTKGRALIDNQTVASPKILQEAMQKLVEGSLLQQLDEATTSVEDLLQKTTQPAVARLGSLPQLVEQRIKEILADKNPLIFAAEETPPEDNVTKQIKYLLSVAQLNNTPTQADSVLSRSGLKQSPLQSLFFAILNIKPPPQEAQTENERAFFDLLKSLATELQSLHGSKAGDKEIRDTLARALKTLQTQFKDLSTPSADKLLSEGLRALKSLEQLANGQEVLNQINPLIQALGEPALVLVPSLMQGLLTRWEISVPPRRVQEEGDGAGGKRSNSEGYERVQLSLPLPALGMVGVDLAHRDGEVLLNLTFSNDELTEFVTARLPRLEAALSNLGFDKIKLSAQSGEIKEAIPAWYRELVRPSKIIA